MSSVDVDNLASQDDGPAVTDDEIIREARKRFRYGMDYTSQARKHFVDDMKFANADAYNMWQWGWDLQQAREIDRRPCMTVNMVRRHNLMIKNDAKQNKSAGKVSPVGDGATADAAQAFEGIVRHIEYISNASIAYDMATETQVDGGIGYWRLLTDYASEDTFDQEIFIEEIQDPLSVLIDPDCRKKDRSDAAWGFVFSDVPRKKFDADYPKWADYATVTGGSGFEYELRSNWIGKDHVRVAEYYRRGEEDDELLGWVDDGEMKTARASSLGPEMVKILKKRPDCSVRKITKPKVEWFKIVGDVIVDRRDTVWQNVPIYPVIGEETLIDGQYDCKGHTRSMLDPQRNLNYQWSAAIEATSLFTKTPWLIPAEAIGDNETAWANANIDNAAYLPWQSRDEQGQPVPKPERIDPPTMPTAYVELVKMAVDNLQEASGQHDADLGKPGNEKSGIAIQQRQRMGDRATYHYVDNLAIAIRRTVKDLIYAIPKVYDTRRVLQILGEDGKQSELVIDPTAKQAYAEQKREDEQGAIAVMNPTIGRYDVKADVGPNFATRRQETLNALVQVATQSPELVHVIGDLIFRNMDVSGAEEIAERLYRLVPPQALGEGPPPQVAQLTAQNQKLTDLAQKATTETDKLRLALKGKDEMRDIDAFDAETRRMSALQKALPLDQEGLRQIVHQLVQEAMNTSLTGVVAANAPTLAVDAQNGPDFSASPSPQPLAQPVPNGQAGPQGMPQGMPQGQPQAVQ